MNAVYQAPVTTFVPIPKAVTNAPVAMVTRNMASLTVQARAIYLFIH